MQFLLLWLACAFIGAVIGAGKGRKTQGFWVGLLFGPIGILAMMLASPVKK